jgi:hypothetical protein
VVVALFGAGSGKALGNSGQSPFGVELYQLESCVLEGVVLCPNARLNRHAATSPVYQESGEGETHAAWRNIHARLGNVTLCLRLGRLDVAQEHRSTSSSTSKVGSL